MSKRINAEQVVHFGERLARLRKAAGFTQVELAAELDISQRMVERANRWNARQQPSEAPISVRFAQR